jgi:hypothetical protein
MMGKCSGAEWLDDPRHEPLGGPARAIGSAAVDRENLRGNLHAA